MASGLEVRQWLRNADGVARRESPWLACFLRWADHEETARHFRKSSPLKHEVRCRECGAPFVKYVYEKTVRCEVCRGARRIGPREKDR